MNDIFEWLYDNYALPLMSVGKQADAIREVIAAHAEPDQLFVQDQLETLCMVWGTEAFTIGLQLGLRLSTGQNVPESPAQYQ